MYPQVDIFGITVYTFGLCLSVSFLLFFWMLYRLSLKFGINTNFFLGNTLIFFISIFIFSRIFYIIAEWRDYKFILNEGIFRFFFMSNYNFSLMGGIFGFMLILYIKIRKHKLSSRKYIDAICLSFFFAAIAGFLGAFLGGEILGKPTDLPIGIVYNSSLSNNPYISPTFPLAIVYSIVSFLLFVILYIIKMVHKTPEGIIGYIGIIIFFCSILVLEYFNSSMDIFSSFIALNNFSLNMNQLGALLLILFGVRGMIKVYKYEQ